MKSALDELQDRLEYTFQNISLLQRALTHSSARVSGEPETSVSNERLEFLGDAVLQLILTEALEKLFPGDAEGALTTKRATLVRGDTLAGLAREKAIAASIRLGGAADSRGARELRSTLENALEAIAGAIFLDAGFGIARETVLRWYGPLENRLAAGAADLNPKGALQEIVQPQHGNEAIVYKLLGTTGRDHERQFSVALYICGEQMAIGEGASKKAAEEVAARLALPKLRPPPIG